MRKLGRPDYLQPLLTEQFVGERKRLADLMREETEERRVAFENSRALTGGKPFATIGKPANAQEAEFIKGINRS